MPTTARPMRDARFKARQRGLKGPSKKYLRGVGATLAKGSRKLQGAVALQIGLRQLALEPEALLVQELARPGLGREKAFESSEAIRRVGVTKDAEKRMNVTARIATTYAMNIVGLSMEYDSAQRGRIQKVMQEYATNLFKFVSGTMEGDSRVKGLNPNSYRLKAREQIAAELGVFRARLFFKEFGRLFGNVKAEFLKD